MKETETQIRLRRANDALAACRANENELRKALAVAIESTRRSKEKAEDLFLKDQQEQVKRLKADYWHCTA